MSDLRSFYGANAGFVLELYDRYLHDPQSIDPSTRAFFEHWSPDEESTQPPAAQPEAVSVSDLQRAVKAAQLAEALRRDGYQYAHLDPLDEEPETRRGPSPADFELSTTDLSRLPATIIDDADLLGGRSALDAVNALRRIYCDHVGYEFDQVQNDAARTWLRRAAETGRFYPAIDAAGKKALLERLTQVGSLERYLHQAFPGKTRFSVEGTGILVPMLDAVIESAGASGIRDVVLGMAHRGRLNVLAHILNRPYEEVMAEFREADGTGGAAPANGASPDSEGYTGDVRYHLGARALYQFPNGNETNVVLVPNPSHLEHVNPVVQGWVRADQDDRAHRGAPVQRPNEAMAVLVHGDAAFPGQGVVAESLNLSRLAGYGVAGAIHIICNNQLGFTTEPDYGRSTRYSSDLARGFGMPVIHVNADDAVACIAVIRMACAYRQEFREDIIVDLMGYRRWGHNEGDEPAFTQPTRYKAIAKHPTVRELWARNLDREELVPAATAEAMLRSAIERLQEARRSASASEGIIQGSVNGHAGMPAEPAATAVPAEVLIALNQELVRLPEGFTLHPRLARPWQRRADGLQPDGTVDWGHAESLALASILADGVPVRLSGQDSERGTFSQRHAVLHDAETDAKYIPLQALPSARASFALYNSPLSESAVVGFEYGYSVEAPETLVLWEAQYGDFANGAQVMIDQFVTSGAAKWRQYSGLVMLLPHAYEGAGPEHSSARLERFLQLAAKNNIRVVNCSTAAQYFHLLRRQAALLKADRRPLIVMTPKSLLRLPEAASRTDAFTQGAFRPLIDDEQARRRAGEIRKLVLSSGKVYYDLLSADRDRSAPVALVRVEELYPFPEDELKAVVAGYPRLQEVAWVQEEPENMGAWRSVERRIRSVVGDRIPVTYIGRAPWASPAEGSSRRHAVEQARIVAEAFGGVANDAPSRNLGVGHAR